MSDLREYTKLCSMGIHESIVPPNLTDCVSIIRVPGGWIYVFEVMTYATQYDTNGGADQVSRVRVNHVFVPFFKEGG